ncbi:MAG TPA: TonB-dependent receptor, partial [Chitinophaga sp.]
MKQTLRFGCVILLAALTGHLRLHGHGLADHPGHCATTPAPYFQAVRITGRVLDAAGTPLPGVTIRVKGTALGAVTLADGTYSINLPDSSGHAVLQVSFIGYEPQEVPVSGRTTVDITLRTTEGKLNEVVVIGYGTQRKRDLTGAIANVQGAELAQQPVQTPTQAVQGKVAGVQVISSGQPNQLPQVRVRGTGSALAGVNPLYVVDGVLTDDIRNLNNADIVSMDVLKDASAAIYGVRAANGVIIITTKKGKAGKMQINYDGNAGFREAANIVKLANAAQYTDYLRSSAPDTYAQLDADRDNGLIYNGNGSTDWYKALLRKAFQMSHNLALSGGTEKSTFYYSLGYNQEDGIIRTNDFNRLTFRANNEVNISNQWKFSSQLSYAHSAEQAVDPAVVLPAASRAAPLVPVKIGDLYGNTSSFGNVSNPALSLDKRDNRLVNNRFMGNVALDFTPIKSLRFHTAFNADLNYGNNRSYYYQYLNDNNTFSPGGGTQQQQNSTLNVYKGNSLRWVWDNNVTWEEHFNKHHLTVLAGTVTEQFYADTLSGSRINVPASKDQWFLNLGNPDLQSTLTNGGDKATRQSFVGRVSYDFAGKYLLSASLRADGSSKFASKWGYFPTVGVGWVLTEEDFLKSSRVLNFLKLRASWGQLGNDNIASNLYTVIGGINVPYFYDNNLSLGTVIQDIKDANLKWEVTDQIDVGFEYGFLDNRLTGELDYYSKKTRDAITFVTIPAIFGDPDNQYVTNAATYTNKGFEFSANWSDKIGQDFTYTIGGNITFNTNKVVGLNGGQALLAGGVGQQGYVTRTDNKEPVGSYYVRKVLGIFQSQEEINQYVNKAGDLYQPGAAPGDFKYADLNGDGVIDDNDKYYAGSYQPKCYYGFNISLGYKGFDLGASFYGNAGNKIY